LRYGEQAEDYCVGTGKKLKQLCKNEKNLEYDIFRSCQQATYDDQTQVIIFQVVCAVVGGIAFWGVQTRKQAQMTLFEYRKFQRYVLSFVILFSLIIFASLGLILLGPCGYDVQGV
jgi:hypothetical protein